MLEISKFWLKLHFFKESSRSFPRVTVGPHSLQLDETKFILKQVKVEVDSDEEMTEKSSKYTTSKDERSDSEGEKKSSQNAMTEDGFPSVEHYVSSSW